MKFTISNLFITFTWRLSCNYSVIHRAK